MRCIVSNAAHESFRVWHLPVEGGTREVEARVLGLEALEHERLLYLTLRKGVDGRVALQETIPCRALAAFGE